MKRGSRAPQHSKQQVRQPGRRKKQPDTQREGPIQQKLDWARTPPGNNRGGRGGDSHTHHKQHNREPQCKGGRNREATEETRANKGTQPSKRRQPPKKQQNKRQPKGRGWTATMRRQSGGGAEKGHAIRTHRATWPMRAEISDTQGTHSLGHNIKLTTKGVKHGPERARGGKAEGRESLCHTSCNVFEVMVFVRSKGLIPTVANREGNRMQRFLLFGTKTQPVALVPEGIRFRSLRLGNSRPCTCCMSVADVRLIGAYTWPSAD